MPFSLNAKNQVSTFCWNSSIGYGEIRNYFWNMYSVFGNVCGNYFSDRVK